MGKISILLISFFSIIFIHTLFDSPIKTNGRLSNTIKPAPIDSPKKKGVAKIVDQLFRANERKRIRKTSGDYFRKDSLAAAKKLNNAVGEINLLVNKANTLQNKLDSINRKHIVDSLTRKIAIDKNNKSKKTSDSVALIAKIESLSQQIKTLSTKKPDTQALFTPPKLHAATAVPLTAEKQSQLNFLWQTLKAPVIDSVQSKSKDSVIIKKLSYKHDSKYEIMGFLADTMSVAASSFDTINFKLITTLVYAINADKLPLPGDDIRIISSAQQHGVNVILSVYTTQAKSTFALLDKNNSKDNLADNLVRLIKKYNAIGVNFDFEGLNNAHTNAFTALIYDVNAAYKKENKKYTISVTIPGDNSNIFYNVKNIEQYVNYFIIDFNKKPEAGNPMSATNFIKARMDAYMAGRNKKIILCLPYYGIKWRGAKNSYIAYDNIQNTYFDLTVAYNDDQSAAYVTAKDKDGVFKVWYDNEITLNKKYIYVKDKELGGVALKFLGNDGTSNELKNALISNFGVIDTAVLIVHRNHDKASFSDFWVYLTTNPCGHNILPIYSQILLIINLSLILVLIIIALTLFFGVKKYGELWAPRKKLKYSLIGVFVLWTFVFLMWLFFWDKNDYFGPGLSDNCVNISFATLFLILLAGTCIGAGIYWFYKLNTPDKQP